MVIDTGIPEAPRFFVYNSEFTFENNIILYNYREFKFNKAILLFYHSKIVFANSSMKFVNNSVPTGGIFVMVNSALSVDGDFYAKFENNEGSDGGAMTFYKQSYIENKIQINTHDDDQVSAHFIFNNNLAHKRGGAIFIEDVDYIESFDHKYRLFFLTDDDDFKLKLDLFNNTAKASGNEVYGGWIDCISNAKFNITIDNFRAVTSNPLRICMCTNSIPNCITEKELTIFPGQMFQFKAAAVGQRYGIVSNIVTAELLGSNGNLEQGQDVQSVGGECTMLYYTVYSNQDFERIRLRVGDLLTNRWMI